MVSARSRPGLRHRTAAAALAAAIATTPLARAQSEDDAPLAREATALLNAARERPKACEGRSATNARATDPDGPTTAPIGGARPAASETSAAIPDERPSRPPLRWNPLLAHAATRHADELALHGRFEHVGPDGSTVRERVSATGYRWRALAENLAAGHPDLRAAIDGWLESGSHCTAVLDARFSEFGLARSNAVAPVDTPTPYWILVLGRPR